MPSQERTPELGHRILAAAGASVVSALLVNPLDVVKIRLQASTIVVDRPLPSCLLTRMPGRYPVRWARPPSLADCASKLPAGAATSCTGGLGPAAQLGSAASQLHRPLLGQLPMSSCACAMKIADLGPASLGTPERCLSGSPYRPVTASGVLRDIVRKEGVGRLWRGTDTAMLASIPMVGVYMPLYDYLLQQMSTEPFMAPYQAYVPAAAGSVARTLAVLLVGPLELVRTRQQGSAAGARTAWGALKDTLRDTRAAPAALAASSGSISAAVGPGRTTGLRMLPRLWTGVMATLARDVPFSALYWALLEPVRGSLLAHWQLEQQQEQAASMLHAEQSAARERQARADAHSPGRQPQAVGHASSSSSDSHLPRRHQEQQTQGVLPQEQEQAVSTGQAVLAANLMAGGSAGAISAVVTTPFDVIKTKLQTGDVRSSQTSLEVLRRVLQTEGPGGLFRGWGPRAMRTAPACALVVASYEVLKLL